MAEPLTPAEAIAAGVDEALADALAEALTGPKRSKRDGVEMESHSLADLIAASEYLRRINRDGKPRRRPPIRLHKMRPPGSI